MLWRYRQSTGELTSDHGAQGTGYSGHGEGKNNPAAEHIRNVGPIPAGRYTIGPAFTHARKGPVCMRLTPVGHDARGRSGFMIHGDSKTAPGEASNGCIVLPLNVRQAIAAAGPACELIVEA